MISSSSPSVKIQLMGWKVCLRCKGKTFLGIVNKLFVVDNIQQCFAFTPFPPIIWIFTEGEDDGIESRLSSYTCFTLLVFISSALACQNYITCSVCQALLEPTNTWNAFAEDSSKRMAFFCLHLVHNNSTMKVKSSTATLNEI